MGVLRVFEGSLFAVSYTHLDVYKRQILGNYVEVGCNSVLNPGTIIGSNTNIYPLSSVRGYVPKGSIYKKQGDIVEKR